MTKKRLLGLFMRSSKLIARFGYRLFQTLHSSFFVLAFTK
jgi:hypothetical protein